MTFLFYIVLAVKASLIGILLMFFAGMAMHEIPKFIIRKAKYAIAEKQVKKNPAYVKKIIMEFSKTPTLMDDGWKDADSLKHPKLVIQKCILVHLAANHSQEANELFTPLLVDTLSYQKMPIGVAHKSVAQNRELEKLLLEDISYCYHHIPDRVKPLFAELTLEKYGQSMIETLKNSSEIALKKAGFLREMAKN